MFNDISSEAQAELERRELWLLRLGFGFILLAALTVSLAKLAGGQALAPSFAHWVVIPAWIGAAWLMRRALSRSNPGRDPVLLPVILLLCGWGQIIVWRLTPGLGARQTAWFLVGSLILVELLRTPSDLSWLRRYRYLWLVGGLALTALTLVFGTNPAGGEPRLWLGCCNIYLQPSEPLRLLLIVFVAAYLSDRMLVRRLGPVGRDLLPLALAVAVAGLLLVAQHDLGTAVLFLTLLAVMLYIAFGHLLVLVAAGGMVLIGGVVGYFTLGLVQSRIDAWLNPWADPTGAGYQLVQSVIAIASGGLLGSGPGLGSPSAVPVVQSDFVFSAVAEEWGMLGAIALLILFAVLVGRGLRLAAHARDPFSVLLAGGISAALALQVLLIVAGVTRLLPITGVTLPLISYGGSSLVTNLIGLGLLLLLSRHRTRAPNRFSLSIMTTHNMLSLGWAASALALGWWSIVRAPALTSRTDNPRRAIGSLESRRGQILDRSGLALASTEGESGNYSRSYRVAEAAPIIGYDSPVYGQTGIERSMDAVLRGESGPEQLSIWWHEILYGVPPAGSDLRLTLNSSLQRAAAAQLTDHAGAAIVLDPVSGEILAMASAPSFDPNQLDQQWSELLQRQDAPLLNRATQGYYQPGMVLAPLLFAWEVSDRGLDPNLPPPAFDEPIELLGRRFGCQQPVSPSLDPSWEAALQHACAAPFAALGEQMGADGLQSVLDRYGLTEAPQIRLAFGIPPAPLVPAEFEPLLQAGAAIGQGQLTVTPLQVARAYAVLAAAGARPGLRLVEAVRAPGREWLQAAPLAMQQTVISPTAAQVTLDALPQYTGGFFGYDAIGIGGSNTASWFIGIQQSERVVVVVLEQGSVVTAREVGLSLLREP